MSAPDLQILIEDPAWDDALVRRAALNGARLGLISAGLSPQDWTISLLFSDDARISTLNGEFRGKPAPTNVLSWPAQILTPDAPGRRPPAPDSMDPELGDIALARQTILAEAAAAHLSLEHHLTHLILHGTLHLLGFDHETDEDAALMEGLETAALAELGIMDPYSEDRTGISAGQER